MAYDQRYFRWSGPGPAPNNFEPQQFRDCHETNYSSGAGPTNPARSNYSSTQRPATHFNSTPTTSTSTPRSVDADIHCVVLPNERFYLPTALLPHDSFAVLWNIEDSKLDAGLEIYHFPNKCHPAVVASLSALVPPLRVGNLPASELPSRVRRTGGPPGVQARGNHVTPTPSANSSGGIATVVSNFTTITSPPPPPPPPTLSNASPNIPRAPKDGNTGPADVGESAIPIPVNSTVPGQSGKGSSQASNLGPDLSVFLECHISSVNYFYLDTALIHERGIRCIVALRGGCDIIIDERANLCHVKNTKHKELMSALSSLEPPIFLSELPEYQYRLSLSSGSVESLRPVPKLDNLPVQCYVFNMDRYFLRISDVVPEARQQLMSSSHGGVREGLFHFTRNNYEIVASALIVHSSSNTDNQSGPQGFLASEREIPISSASTKSPRQQAVPSSTSQESATTTAAALQNKVQPATLNYVLVPKPFLQASSVGTAVPNCSVSSTTPVSLSRNVVQEVLQSTPQKSAPNVQYARTRNNQGAWCIVYLPTSRPSNVLASSIPAPAPSVVHSGSPSSPALVTQVQRPSSGIAQIHNSTSTAPIHSTISPSNTPIPPPFTQAHAPTSATSAHQKKVQPATPNYVLVPLQFLPAPSISKRPTVPNGSVIATGAGNNQGQDPVHVQTSGPNNILVSSKNPPAPSAVHSRSQASPAVAAQMQRPSSVIAQIPNPTYTAPIHSAINPRKIPPPVTHAQVPTSSVTSAQGLAANIPTISQTHVLSSIQATSLTPGQNGLLPSRYVVTCNPQLQRPITGTALLANSHVDAQTDKSSCNPTLDQCKGSIPEDDITRPTSENAQAHAVKEMPQISGYQTILEVLPSVMFSSELQTFNKIIKFTLPLIPSRSEKVLFGLRVSTRAGIAQPYFTKLNIWINGDAVEERRDTSCCNLDIPNCWANQLRFGENCIRISSKLSPCEFSPNICYFVIIAEKISAAIMTKKLARKECTPIQATILLVKSYLEKEAESGIIVQDSKVTASLLCPLGKAKMRIPCRGSTCRHYTCFDAFNFIRLHENSEIWKCPICDSHIEFEILIIDGLFQEILNSVGKDVNVNDVTIDSNGKYAPVISPASKTSQNQKVRAEDDGTDITSVNSNSESDSSNSDSGSSVDEIDVIHSDAESARQKQKPKSAKGGQHKIRKLAEKVQKCKCTSGCTTKRCTCKRMGEICGSRCHPNDECCNGWDGQRIAEAESAADEAAVAFAFAQRSASSSAYTRPTPPSFYPPPSRSKGKQTARKSTSYAVTGGKANMGSANAFFEALRGGLFDRLNTESTRQRVPSWTPQESSLNVQNASTGNNQGQDPVHVQQSKPNNVLTSINPPASSLEHSRSQPSPAMVAIPSSGISQMPDPISNATTAPIHPTINPMKIPTPPPVTHAQVPTSTTSAQGQAANIPMFSYTNVSSNVEETSSTSGQNGVPPSHFVTNAPLHRPIAITPSLPNPHVAVQTKSSCNPTIGQLQRSILTQEIASEIAQVSMVCASRKEMPQISGYQTTLAVLPLVTVPWELPTFNKIIKFTLPLIPSPCKKVLLGLRLSSPASIAQQHFTKLKIWINGEKVSSEVQRNTSCCNLDMTYRLRFGENTIGISSKLSRCEFGTNICYFVVIAKKISASKMMKKLTKRECTPTQRTILLVKSHLEREAESGIIVQDSKVTASLLCPLGKAKMQIPCRGSTCRHYTCFDAFNFIRLYENSEIWKCPICDKHIEFDCLIIDGLFQKILNSIGKDANVNDVAIDSNGKYAPVISPGSKTSQKENLRDEEDVFDGIDLTGVNSISEPESSVDEIDVTDTDSDYDVECASQRQKRKAKSTEGGKFKIRKLAENVQKCTCTSGCRKKTCTCLMLGEICDVRCHPNDE